MVALVFFFVVVIRIQDLQYKTSVSLDRKNNILVVNHSILRSSSQELQTRSHVLILLSDLILRSLSFTLTPVRKETR